MRQFSLKTKVSNVFSGNQAVSNAHYRRPKATLSLGESERVKRENSWQLERMEAEKASQIEVKKRSQFLEAVKAGAVRTIAAVVLVKRAKNAR